MKNVLILLSLILVTLPAASQGKKYQKGMLKAIDKMDQATDLAGLKDCAATFEFFSETHPTEWIPSYYASLNLINASFLESDEEAREKLLDRASKTMGYALNMPEFMGGGPEAAKPLFLEAEEHFSSFENDNPLWPSWGAEDVEAELEKLKDI